MNTDELLIKQKINFKIEQTCLSVDDLIETTEPDVFNPETTAGYQRKINPKHCKNIIKYIMDNPFFFPAPIIISTRQNPHGKRWVVDGQHRIEAFRLIKEGQNENSQYKDKYEEIKGLTLPVIVLINPDQKFEIQTFITINKRGRKVDTSLAFILQNKPEGVLSPENTKKAQINFLIAGLALKINDETEVEGNIDDVRELWLSQISYEDNPKIEGKLISISAFARSEYGLINRLLATEIIPSDWKTTEEKTEEAESLIKELFYYKWQIIEQKWPQLFASNKEQRVIIQGPIGCSSINKFIIKALFDTKLVNSISDYKTELRKLFSKLDVPYKNWLKGVNFSAYSSEAGYSVIADLLLESCE